MLTFTRVSASILAASIFVRLSTSTALADPFYWDPSSTGSAGGGTAVWDNSSPFWATAATAGTNTAWAGGSDAILAGAAGNVTLGAPITVRTLSFSTSGYVIA